LRILKPGKASFVSRLAPNLGLALLLRVVSRSKMQCEQGQIRWPGRLLPGSRPLSSPVPQRTEPTKDPRHPILACETISWAPLCNNGGTSQLPSLELAAGSLVLTIPHSSGTCLNILVMYKVLFPRTTSALMDSTIHHMTIRAPATRVMATSSAATIVISMPSSSASNL
jgi:hypothetical protein